MFRALRLKQEPQGRARTKPLTIEHWLGDAQFPLGIRTINALPHDAKQRLYGSLVPPELLGSLGINPILWRGSGYQVELTAEQDSGKVNISLNNPQDPTDAYFVLELEDNSTNGIDLNLILLNDPPPKNSRSSMTSRAIQRTGAP